MAFFVPVVIGIGAVSSAVGLYRYMRSSPPTPASSTGGNLQDSMFVIEEIPLEVLSASSIMMPEEAKPMKIILPTEIKQELEQFNRSSLKHIDSSESSSSYINELKKFKRTQLRKTVSTNRLHKKTVTPFQQELNDYHRKTHRKPYVFTP
jgi:CO dehydrogenase/acetyl-CoA synthase beta subunit